MNPLRIVILYNAPTLPAKHADFHSEAGVLESVKAIAGSLFRLGHEVTEVAAGNSIAALVERLTELRPEIVVNLCESFAGRSAMEPHIAALLDLLGIPYTGSPPEALAITHNKAQTKRLLIGSGIATPSFVELQPNEEPRQLITQSLLDGGPVIIKPAAEDASLGITADSVATDWPEAQRQIVAVQRRYGSVLIEHFIAGREFNVGILELPRLESLPIAEIEFHGSPDLQWPILTYGGKWSPESDQCRSTPVRCPANVDPQLANRMTEVAMAAYRITRCRDYARVDMRVNEQGEVFVLEVNANPDIGPTAGLARMLDTAGIEYDRFVERLIETAYLRRMQSHEELTAGQVVSRVAKPNSEIPCASIRPISAEDRGTLLEITYSTKAFRTDELDVADEILREALRDGPAGHYQVLVIEENCRPIGWSCHGRVPLTDAAFDLYWIVIDPRYQGHGLGRQLLEQVEHAVKTAGGRWLLAETSSTAAYDATRGFYQQCGFRAISEIAHFYRVGDGKITFGKRFDT